MKREDKLNFCTFGQTTIILQCEHNQDFKMTNAILATTSTKNDNHVSEDSTENVENTIDSNSNSNTIRNLHVAQPSSTAQ